jgi:hypothetical protein
MFEIIETESGKFVVLRNGSQKGYFTKRFYASLYIWDYKRTNGGYKGAIKYTGEYFRERDKEKAKF